MLTALYIIFSWPIHAQLSPYVFYPCRRDKYESNIKEYWIDVETSGSYENEQTEELVDKTFAEGTAESFDLGLQADHHAEDNSPGEESGGDEVSEDNDGASSARFRVPSKTDAQREYALEVGFAFLNNARMNTHTPY